MNIYYWTGDAWVDTAHIHVWAKNLTQARNLAVEAISRKPEIAQRQKDSLLRIVRGQPVAHDEPYVEIGWR